MVHTVPAPPVPVSYVMPVLNEEEHLTEAVSAILAQVYPGDAEVVLALGESTDRTAEIAAALAASDPRVRCVDNPDTQISAGLNRAIGAAKHPVIVRVDAHSTLPDGYTATMVEALFASDAAVVGGLMHAQGRTPFQRAVARAYNSPFGLGGGVYHGGGEEGEADSAYLGVFRREVLDEVGGYDETLLRGEDWELASRIRAAGHRVWLVPSLAVTYWPRDTWAGLRRQFLATGTWRGELVRRQGSTPPRYLAPPVLVLGLAAAPVAAAALASGRVRGPLRLACGLSAALPVAYKIGLAAASVRLGGDTAADRLRNMGVLATMHLSWGAGFLRGFTLGAGSTVDRSRVPTKPAGRNVGPRA